jgi:hypothetical protein
MDRDEEYDAWWETIFSMLKCLGCESVVLERCVTSSEYSEPEKEYFPPVASRKKPKWATDETEGIVPRTLIRLLNEVYLALHTDSRSLATMGARTILDMLILDKVGDVGSFKDKLNALQVKGLIGVQQRDFLEAALEAGHASSHRGHIPSTENLDHVMDILENLVAQVYVLPSAAKSLRKSTPKRKRKK